ncbi:MAG: hypothetical protein PHW04_15880 [Candidatus Wallbacteria bacterium]|nr:hypothetical protein [Candidatus Wallbacteria bacterium]
MRKKTVILALSLCMAMNLYSSEFKFSGGALTLMRDEHSVEKIRNYTTHIEKKTSKDQFSSINWYWLDADRDLNEDISLAFRVCNITASKLNNITLEQTGGDEVEWLSFQYAYMKIDNENQAYRLGLVPVNRNDEPLEVHFTPMKTSWTSFWNSTLGSVKGAAISWDAINKKGKPTREVEDRPTIDANFTVAINTDGRGNTIIQQAGTKEIKTMDDQSLDFVLSFPVESKAFRLKPILALRTMADGSRPDDGKGDYRFSYGFTGEKDVSKKLKVPFGIGWSSFENNSTRNVTGHAYQNNDSMYMRVAPAFSLNKGKLVCELKYSTYNDLSKASAVLHKYPALDIKYISIYKKKLITLAPRVRFFGETYTDENTNTKYAKVRIAPEVIFFLTF